MKRPLTILMIAVLTILVIYACGSTIRTANTSFVTITIGDTPHMAHLKAEGATPWVRFKYYLADAKLMPEAYAYIPSVVQVIVVTVTAADITTPIVGVANIAATDTVATVRIDVPNGSARQFTVEGIRGVNSTTYYRGTASADLNGADTNLPVSMNFVGTGIYVDPSLTPGTADVPSCGTLASPCATITYVLNTRPSTTNNDVILALAGTYKVGSVAAQETFPLQLKPGIALLCMGAGLSSVIDASTQFGVTVFHGNDNAAVDNCLIRVGQQGTGVNDVINPQLPTVTAATRINGSTFELPTGATNPTVGVVFANDKSMLIDSSLTGTAASFQALGAQVTGGMPSIIGNTITGLPTGIDLMTNAGDAAITGNHIFGNAIAGINIGTAAKPSISGNTIENNGTGITIPTGNPIIAGNIIRNNSSFGIDISTGGTGTSTSNPQVQGNSISCNGTDVSVVSDSVIDLRNNAWDHDNSTVAFSIPPGSTYPPGPLINQGFIFGGYDIVYSVSTPVPNYTPFNAAVPGGCVGVVIGKPRL